MEKLSQPRRAVAQVLVQRLSTIATRSALGPRASTAPLRPTGGGTTPPISQPLRSLLAPLRSSPVARALPRRWVHARPWLLRRLPSPRHSQLLSWPWRSGRGGVHLCCGALRGQEAQPRRWVRARPCILFRARGGTLRAQGLARREPNNAETREAQQRQGSRRIMGETQLDTARRQWAKVRLSSSSPVRTACASSPTRTSSSRRRSRPRRAAPGPSAQSRTARYGKYISAHLS